MNKITQDWIELTPAYGRDYKSKTAVEADFRAGKDFRGHFGPNETYTSIRDFAPGVKVLLRYKRNTTVASVTV